MTGWGEIDDAILACLAEQGAMAPRDLADRLGLSEAATRSLLALLAQEGRVEILSVTAGAR